MKRPLIYLITVIGIVELSAFHISITEARAGTCYQNISFYNEGGYVASYKLSDVDGDVWSAPSNYSLGYGVQVNGADLGINDRSTIRPQFRVINALAPVNWISRAPEFEYCRNSQTIRYKTWGTIFDPQMGTY